MGPWNNTVLLDLGSCRWCTQISNIISFIINNAFFTSSDSGLNSVARTATSYGLDDPRSNSGVGKIYSNRQDWIQAHPTSCIGSLSRDKAAGAWPLSPTPYCAEVQERVELYLYSTSVFLWHDMG